jgi:hypothetical protein
MKPWHGIMTVLEIEHLDSSGTVLHREENVRNMLHDAGEDFILKVLFGGTPLPANYYIGLDSRTSLVASTTISQLYGPEPTSNAYERQKIQSDNFSVTPGQSGSHKATSPTILFKAVGGSWGPVKNIFLSTGLGYASGVVLVSSASLSRTITVSDGEIITMKMAMSLSGS